MAFHSYDISQLGCLLQVGFKVGRGYARAGKGGPPSSWTALIDTGASMTSISPAIVRDLGPQTLEAAMIYRPDEESRSTLIYEVALKLDGHLSPGRWFDLDVVAAEPATPGIDVLIGMDLLMQFHGYLAGPGGKLVLSY